MNWLKPYKAKEPQKTSAPAVRQAFEEKLAAFKTLHGVRERYSMHCYCSRFGKSFEVVFERANEQERFRVCRIEKLAEGGTARARGAPVTKTFDADLFAMAGWSCPYCRADSYIHCSCGTNTCSHQFRNAPDGMHRCEPGCGTIAKPVRLTKMPATAAGSAPSSLTVRARPSLPASSRASLTGPSKPGLPGPRK